MNLQDIAKKEAERLYPTIGDINPHLNDVNELSQSLFLHGFTFCLNTLAGSEGDIWETVKNHLSTSGMEFGLQLGVKEPLISAIQQHTASAVAKAVGENEELTRENIELYRQNVAMKEWFIQNNLPLPTPPSK